MILPTTILWLHAYLLVEIFQEAIKDFQEVLDRLFLSSDNIFPCDQTAIVSIILSAHQLYCWSIEDREIYHSSQNHISSW